MLQAVLMLSVISYEQLERESHLLVKTNVRSAEISPEKTCYEERNITFSVTSNRNFKSSYKDMH